jgi:CheY-like chemotaxis protein
MPDDYPDGSDDIPMPPRRILVADACSHDGMAVRRLLREQGHEADLTERAEDALARHQNHSYSLILMDARLAAAHRFDAVLRLRKAEPAGSRVPLIACATMISDQERHACLAAGMDDVCFKPLHGPDLRRLLCLWLPAADSAGRRDEDMRADFRALAELFGAGFDEVIGMFRRDSGERLATMRQAAQVSDWSALARLAHALGGSCSSMGGWRMAGLCRALELRCQAQAQAGLPADLSPLLAAISAEYQRLQGQLEDALRMHRQALPGEQSMEDGH